MTGYDVVAVEDTRSASTIDRVAEEGETDCNTHRSSEVCTRKSGLVLKKVVEVQESGRNCLCETSSTTVDHGCCEGSCGCVCVPHHRVLGLVRLESCTACTLDNDFVLNCTLNERLDNSTDGSGLAVCLNKVVDDVVCVQTLVGVEQKLCTLERTDCVTHLKLTCLSAYPRDSLFCGMDMIMEHAPPAISMVTG